MRKGDLALSGAETADSAAPGPQVPPGSPAAAGGALRAETWPIIRRGELAHREAFTLQMFGVAAAVAGIFALAFATIGPFESHHVLTVAQRLAYCAVSGGLHLIVAYAGFVATLYLTRGRTELQTVVALALEALVIAAPCTAITYTVYGVYAHLHLSPPVHDFRIIREIYSAAVPPLLGATALVYYVLRLRVSALQGAGGGASAEMRPPGSQRCRPSSALARPAAGVMWYRRRPTRRQCSAQAPRAMQPPLTLFSLARNRTTCAISSGRPGRPRGWVVPHWAMIASESPDAAAAASRTIWCRSSPGTPRSTRMFSAS